MNIVKKCIFLSCLGLLVFSVACGNSNTTGTGFGGGGTSGSFSNSNLKGNYTYQIAGYDLTSGTTAVPFREAGAFVADGKGNITGGEDDFAEGTSVSQQAQISSGTYQISNDGTGELTLNIGNGSLPLAISVESAPTVYLNVGAQGANGTGIAFAQTTSAFAAVPSGTFVFRTHNVNSVSLNPLQSSAAVGVFAVSTNAVSGGIEDQWSGQAVTQQLPLTGGSFSLPDSFGRGTATLTDNNAITSTFSYYITDSSHLYLFSTATNGNVGLGQAEAQSGAFSNSSLSGSYVFGTRGDDASVLGGVNTVGQFSASGGAISGGQFDSAQDGNVTGGATITASNYTVAPNGRSVLALAGQELVWMVSPSRAFFLTNDTTKVEDGTADLQQSSSFSKSSLNGQFGFANDGFLNATSGVAFYDRAGYLHWDGAGNLGVKELLIIDGLPPAGGQPGILNGTYTVASNGRVTGNVNTLSGNLVFYLISGSQAYVLQGDTGVEINGTMGAIP